MDFQTSSDPERFRLFYYLVQFAREPIFFRETNPQPRKHTLWQASTDFTDGQATINRIHYLECPPSMLIKHYEKLIQCDTRLGILSQQPEKVMCSPLFESQTPVESPEYSSRGDQCNQLIVCRLCSYLHSVQDQIPWQVNTCPEMYHHPAQ